MDRGSAPAIVRIAVQSSDRLRRDTLAAYLDTLPDFSVVGRAPDPASTVSVCELQQPDILLVDSAEPPSRLAGALRMVRDRFPRVRIVLCYQRLSPEELTAVHDAGVDALVPHAHGLPGLLSVLRVPSPLARRNGWHGNGFTARQREILTLVASGHNVSEIADLLNISPGTVENHKRRVYAKLNATSAAQAVFRAASLGIIDRATNGRHGRAAALVQSGHALLAVVVGPASPVLDEVVTTLIRHLVPVVREHLPRTVEHVHWLHLHRGPVLRILVDPAADQWRVGATLGQRAILVHSGAADSHAVAQAIGHGVIAVVDADHVVEQLIPVLRLAASGYLVMDPASTGPFIEAACAQLSALPNARAALTAREQDILHSIGRNHTVRQTARSLGIAAKTVENAQGNLFRKLGVNNRAAALATAYSLGLLPGGEAQPDNGAPARPAIRTNGAVTPTPTRTNGAPVRNSGGPPRGAGDGPQPARGTPAPGPAGPR